ncbi:Multidrug resistance-associated protein 4 [Phlyctochytrium planicorne]|nr:Multidrug resistance-associated protein 4 [Phlyctochytrium planicorne]
MKRPEQMSFFSRWTFSYMNPLMDIGGKRELEPEDYFCIEDQDESTMLANRIQKAWKEERERKEKNPNYEPKLWKAIIREFGNSYIYPGVLCLLESWILIGEAYTLGTFLNWFEEKDAHLKDGIIYASVLSAAVIIHSFIHQMQFFLAQRVGIQLRVGFIAAVYQKCLKLSISNTSSTGKIVNMISNDVQRFEDAAAGAHYLWLAPLEAVIITVFLYREISWAAFAAVVALFGIMPLQGYFAKLFGDLRHETVECRDSRIKSVSDGLAGIMTVKLYAWEKPIQESINKQRDQELVAIRKASFLRSLNQAMYFSSAAIIELFAFVAYWWMGGILTPAKVFSCIMYISSIRLSMCDFYPSAREMVSESMVSFERVQQFLSLPEITQRTIAYSEDEGKTSSTSSTRENDSTSSLNKTQNDLIQTSKENDSIAIKIENANFYWGMPDEENASGLKAATYKSSDASETLNDLESVVVVDSTKIESEKDDRQLPGWPKPVLQNINLTVKKGELVAIIGPVGCGKSSLLNAILGEMDTPTKSLLSIFPSTTRFGYCTQQPYILPGSLQDNILFGLPYNASKFLQTLKACALDRDLERFPDREKTMVGEKGVTLSGGQRARLALARAVYADAEVYLLDDPLSAVDSQVGRHLFEVCLRGALKGKTTVLVTHQLKWARQCDRCVVMEGGKVLAAGGYLDVMNKLEKVSKFARAMKEMEEVKGVVAGLDDGKGVDELVKDDDSEVARSAAKDSRKKVNFADANEEKSEASPFVEEESAIGSVHWKVYSKFFKFGTTTLSATILIILLILGQVILIMTDWFLSLWSLLTPEEQRELKYPLIFISLAVGTFIFAVVRSALYFTACINATQEMFRKMLSSVFRSPMQFFHENPHGRLMNRFAKDLGLTDEMLPLTSFDYLQCSLMILGTFIVAIIAIPFVLIFVPFVIAVLIHLRKRYLVTSRQIKRYESVTRSPVYSNIPTTLEGLSTIRAFHTESRVYTNFMNLQNENTRIVFCYQSSSRWLGLRLDILSALFFIVLAVTTLVLRGVAMAKGKDEPLAAGSLVLSSGVLGLLLSYALQLVALLQWAVRQSAEVENMMVGVERILEYTKLPSEAPEHTDIVPSQQWPERGDIKLKNVSMKYPKAANFVLDKVNVHFPAGSKVGIVGRTGAGKSSLLQVLFRLVEPSEDSALIIDGINIKELGLHDLRSRIAIIPQEPFCFKGTLRYNLDPFGVYEDQKLWDALESVEMKDIIMASTEKLDCPVEENGGNWSVGERQLICLARAILRNSKVIVMDEATSAVDMRTDALIQKAIRSKGGLFESSTVITIAHRLQTIIDFDYVLVLDAGHVVEFGKPVSLLDKSIDNSTAWFSRMVNELGPEARETLYALATRKDNPIASS